MRQRKAWLGCLWLLMICLLAAGCGKDARLKDIQENILSVKKNGKIEEYLVEKLDKDYYSAEALESYIDSEAEAVQGVSVKDFSVESDMARAEIHYDDPESFLAFNGQAITICKLSEADAQDISLATEGSVPDDGYVIVTEFETRLIGPGDPVAWSEDVSVSEDGICRTTAKRCVMIYK